ncbi:MAG TPA: M20/M25/M40 family metallo-hydrolase [Anaeromyxobacteraceae bacterium]|nr:M20/M25/M40 family metallo-hydrolase [Anaeromyxobacteraceae bacterium]
MRRAALLALPAALLLSCAAARPAPPPSAEASIRPADLVADVAWLADAERTGRGVGTPGNEAATRFLAARMEALGLRPAGSEGFLQPFEAPVEALLRGENALSLAGAALQSGKDWQPFTFSSSGTVEGELVWAGYGITAPELQWDDYAGLEVKGKVVLVAAHFAREDDPASPFRDPRAYSHGEWRAKAVNARDHGAAALIGVRDDWHHRGADDLPPWKGAVASPVGIPMALATLAALARAGVDAPALAREVAAEGKPRPRPLGTAVRLAVDIEQRRALTANVVGLFPGSDPALAGECVVVGAHYDHLGYGGESAMNPEDTGRVHPGADDNASGTAALLSMARAFAAAGPPRRTVLFAAFSGEELGVLGSSRLVQAPPPACPAERMQLMVNLDMVGRPRDGRVFVEGAGSARDLRQVLEALPGREPALPLRIAFGGDGYGPSDQTPFLARGVPAIYVHTGAHGDYHRITDTADKIDPQGLAAVTRLAFRAAFDASQRPDRLVAVRAPAKEPRPGGGERGYGAYLGTIPDFAERAEPGVLVSAVRPGSPAEKAGLLAGDVVTGVGRVEVKTLADLGVALRSHRPGDVVEVRFQRGGEARRVQATLGERR